MKILNKKIYIKIVCKISNNQSYLSGVFKVYEVHKECHFA